jgi:hypothetical protein
MTFKQFADDKTSSKFEHLNIANEVLKQMLDKLERHKSDD